MRSAEERVANRFSIVVPSYQQGRYIRATLESLLVQGDPDLEILVQDGGSTDETVQILKSFGSVILWESKRDGGQTEAINLGLKRCTGEFVGYLNSDDVLYPGTLALIRSAFLQNPRSDFVYGKAHHIDERNDIIEEYPVESWDYDRLLQNCFLCQPATFWRHRVHDQIGYFEENLHFCMDYEFWLRAGQSHSFFYLPRHLAGARRHSEAKTSRLRGTGNEEVCRILPQYNRGFLPLKWARARAKTNAEKSIVLQEPRFLSWCRYARIYWPQLFRALPQLTFRDRIRLFGRLLPPYWSSRTITARMRGSGSNDVEPTIGSA